MHEAGVGVGNCHRFKKPEAKTTKYRYKPYLGTDFNKLTRKTFKR